MSDDKKKCCLDCIIIEKVLSTAWFILFTIAVILTCRSQIKEATLLFGAGIICLIFASLDKFKSFKALGVEAALIDQKVKEADDLLEKLKNLAVSLSHGITIIGSGLNRGGGYSNSIKAEMFSDIANTLKELNIPKEKINESLELHHYFIAIDMIHIIITNTKETVARIRGRAGRHHSTFIKGGDNPETVETCDKMIKICDRLCKGLSDIANKSLTKTIVHDLNTSIQSIKDEVLPFEDPSSLFFKAEELEKALDESLNKVNKLEHYLKTHEHLDYEEWKNEEGYADFNLNIEDFRALKTE